ncbi:hypothetical protein [[Flexibacter] sp. ATCC 35208]|uniref:hypothetical protein n=1 Tax=[Flexibacter] sp. ATCC 35208 TaxID=1936242 RepID=UPI0009CCB643|nr:hypothetical protein [[Flexibacter] sp. ATCC 35208]OMP79179.1 hypothetical protein BW716_11235 [[Flexibacter] sp. ATCC 35208]
MQEYLQGYISKKYGEQYQQNNGKYLLCLVFVKVSGGQIVDAVAASIFTGYLVLPWMGQTDGRSNYFITYQSDLVDRPYAGMIASFTGELMF